MPLVTDNDLLSLFAGGQFSDEPVEDEVLACFTDGQFGSELAVAIVVPPRPIPARVAVGGGGGGSHLALSQPLTYYYSSQPDLVPVSVDPWADGWMSRRRPRRPRRGRGRRPPPRPPLFPSPPPPGFAGLSEYPDYPEHRELPWKAIAFGALGVLIGIVIAKTLLKDAKWS